MKTKKEHKGLKSFISSEYRNMVRYVKRYLNEKYYDVSAEDVVQDVALNMFSKLDLDEQLENIAGYVYRSIKNKISDIRNKKDREIPFEKFTDDEGNEYILTKENVSSDDFLNEIDDTKFYNSLNSALNKLSPSQQMVFIATEFDGYTFEELSEELDIPIGTLLSWKHRGVKKLKELIRPEDFYRENEY